MYYGIINEELSSQKKINREKQQGIHKSLFDLDNYYCVLWKKYKSRQHFSTITIDPMKNPIAIITKNLQNNSRIMSGINKIVNVDSFSRPLLQKHTNIHRLL